MADCAAPSVTVVSQKSHHISFCKVVIYLYLLIQSFVVVIPGDCLS